ncbi:DNA polymerase theta isoform X2 [Sitophilus oryzae]|nr:DNA polymerase theta isoform X2 [Sitophilus oryzae]
MGSYNPPGGINSIHMAICTIEKANNLINKFLEENTISEIGAVIVDEMHLLGDPSRGYLLELLLTKLRYICLKNENIKIQLVGMSATLPNLSDLAEWLNADLFTTSFRPVPLHEQIIVCGDIYDKNLKLIRKCSQLPELENDGDHIIQLCLETVKCNSSVLIFCPSKNWCEKLAQQLALAFYKIGNMENSYGEILRSQMNKDLILEVLEQLKYCPVGLDEILYQTISFGIAFHHAGLTLDERDIIESAFRNGAVRILIATSTLSSGVNLPARRVLIRSPKFFGKPMDSLVYQQMIGRAGRMGKDTIGESFLICQKNEFNVATTLVSGKISAVQSCLEGGGKLKRAILEVISSGVATSPYDIKLFTDCTLLSITESKKENLDNPIHEAVEFLIRNEFIKMYNSEDGTGKYTATSLGKACLSSSIAPDEGLALFTELEKARQCFVLESELHLIYLVTPYSACNSWDKIDWMFYLDLWDKLLPAMKKVGELVGVKESYIVNATRGKVDSGSSKSFHELMVHKRFFVALVLQDLVNEIPLNEVCSKYNCNRGMLQSLQQSAATFAGMVTAFSRKLGWSTIELLVSQFQDRMQFGVNRDLLDLMKLHYLNGKIARILYNGGIQTLIDLANAEEQIIENIFFKAEPFESSKIRDGESNYDNKKRNKLRNVWISGKEGLTEMEAAKLLIQGAREYLQMEMGLKEAKWKTQNDTDNNIEQISQLCVSTKNDMDVESSTANVKITFDNKMNYVENQEEEKMNNVENSKFLCSADEHNISDVEHMNKMETSDIPDDSFNISSFNFSTLNESLNEIDKKNSNIDIETHHSQENTTEECIRNNNKTFNFSQENITDTLLGVNFTQIEKNLTQHKISDNEILGIESSEAKMDFLEFNSSFEMNISNSSIFKTDQVSGNRSDSPECSFSLQLTDESFNKPLDDFFHVFDENEERHIKQSFTETKFKKQENTVENNNIDDSFLNSDDSLLDATPPKKSLILDKLSTPGNKISLVNFKDIIEQVPSVSKVNILSVTDNDNLLSEFCKDLQLQKEFSLSMICRKISERIIIGANIISTVNTTHVNPLKNATKTVGISFYWGGTKAYYLAMDNNETCHKIKKLLKHIFSQKDINVKMFNSKEQIKLLNICYKIRLCCKIEDPKIADWLLDPDGKEKSLETMVHSYNGALLKILQMTDNPSELGNLYCPTDDCAVPKTRVSVEATLTWYLVQYAKERLSRLIPSFNSSVHSSFPSTYELEMRIVPCIANMELSGMTASKTSLQNVADLLKNQQKDLENKAFSLAGRRFSFTSSVEVAKAVGLYRGKKMSTKRRVLEQSEHPIADLVLQWRKINLTITKMVNILIYYCHDDKIHGNYISHTATGRITMHEPNIQMVNKDFTVENPITQEKTIISCRGAFNAPEGCVLISADYCQLELRILTYLSKDELLMNVMNEPGDIFKSIAAQWNNISEEEVTDNLRQQTKQLCYAIIYGMGAKSLSGQLDISEEEAFHFMERFKDTYIGIKHFIKQTIDSCRKHGYVETIIGRRRYLPHINHKDSAMKSQAERQAVNTKVQGSAADLVKNAMVTIEDKLDFLFKKSKSRPALTLHLHDELIYEVPEKYTRKVVEIVKNGMEHSTINFGHFPVKVKVGKSWGELEEYVL